LLDSKLPHEQEFKAGAPEITDHLCDECAAHWIAVRRLLDSASMTYQVNPYLVRGLDYYTRTVFEFYPGGASGQQDALASGGRYDGLAEAEGWPSTPGVGFAGGIDRVVELMAASGQEALERPAADVVVRMETCRSKRRRSRVSAAASGRLRLTTS
jgi:histidyl-tRNA synthetase